MGSALSLSHWEALPPEVLQICVARMTRPGAEADGDSWSKVSKVCKGWRVIAGMFVKVLQVDCLGRTRDSTRVYKQYPKLKKLGVSGRVSNGFMEQFGALTSLRELTLIPDTYRKLLVTDQEVMLLANFAQLTRLELLHALGSKRYLKGRDVQSIALLVNLKELSVAKAPATLYLYLTSISTLTSLTCAQWEDEIVGLSRLQALQINKCKDDAFTGSNVSRLSNLASLHVSIPDNLDSGPILNIDRLQHLTALSKLRLDYTDHHLFTRTWRQLSSLSQLQSLHISNPRRGVLTISMVEAVASLKHLQDLFVETSCLSTGALEDDCWPEMQSMLCLKTMKWTVSRAFAPAGLLEVAATMMKVASLQGYEIVDDSGIQVA